MDDEYIPRKAALSFPFANGQYDREHADEHFIHGCESYREWIEQLPAANVVEAGEAEWRYQTMSVPGGKGQTYAKWSCSVCKGKQKMRSRYCPYCGKKMKNGWQKE